MVSVLIMGFGRMGKIHAKHLEEMGVAWKWHDPHLPESRAFDLARFSHIIIATPILTHYWFLASEVIPWLR